MDISEVQRLNLQPGDLLVVRFRQPIPATAAAAVMARVQAWAGTAVPVLILDGDASLEVVTADGEVREITR